jgi:hypothetical protein
MILDMCKEPMGQSTGYLLFGQKQGHWLIEHLNDERNFVYVQFVSCHYHDDRLHGEYQLFKTRRYWGLKIPIESVMYENGVRHGWTTTWHENGKRRSIRWYQYGRQIRQKIWGINGRRLT